MCQQEFSEFRTIGSEGIGFLKSKGGEATYEFRKQG